jgi:predicted permease
MILHHLRADARYALKWLARSPGFTAIAVASLGIGIGFNAALFSVVDALLLRPLTIERPDRIIDVYTRGSDGDTYATSSYPDYLDFKSQNVVFTDVLAYSPVLAAVKTGDQSRMALGEVVTGNYFDVLGVSAAIGRTLLPEDDRPGAPRTVVISDRLWGREYHADPSIVGRSVHIHGQAYTIVGVAPRTFTGMLPMLQPEMWIPVAWADEVEPAGIQDSVPSPTGKTRFDRRGQRWLLVRGRLKDQETVARAQANLQLIMQQLESAHPATNTNRPVSVAANVRVHPDADRALRPIALGLMLGVGLVLLVACGNVANMLLARASGRQREIGIRLAIGATRRRLIAQLVTEGMVLGLMGAVAGAGLATVFLRLIEALPLPIPIPIEFGLRLDTRVLLFTTVVALASGILAGLAPALRATRPNLTGDLKGEMSMMRAGRRRLTLRDTLVVAQTAFTVVLLVTAGLLTRSIVEARRLDLGFQATAGNGHHRAFTDRIQRRARESRARARPGDAWCVISQPRIAPAAGAELQPPKRIPARSTARRGACALGGERMG